MSLNKSLKALVVCIGLLLGASSPALAEVHDVKLSMQYGLGHLAIMIMRHNKLVEKNLKAEGLTHTKVSWYQLTGSAAMNDALLAGSIDFTSGGLTGVAKLWAASGGRVKSIGAEDSMPMYLNTTNPKIKNLRDFGPNDRIALPAVKVSPQAIVLEMAAQKVFGNYAKLDPLTVTMKHPDAMIAMLSGSNVDCHFGFPPFEEEELKDPKVHTVLNSYNVLGGPTTIVVMATTVDFYKKNPRTYKAVVNALKEALAFINNHKRKAAEIYIKVAKDKRDSVEDIYNILNNHEVQYSYAPHNSMQFVDFMYKRGIIKVKPKSWRDLYFPNVWKAAGAS